MAKIPDKQSKVLAVGCIAEIIDPVNESALLQLAPEWEEAFRAHQVEGERGALDVALPPEKFNRFSANVAEKLARAGEKGVFPAVVTSARRRRFVKTALAAKGILAPVLSYEEIGAEARPAIVGLVTQ